MSHSFNLFEPDFSYVMDLGRSWHDPVKGGEESIRQAWAVFHAFEQLMPASADNSYREVWFKVSRGEPKDWMSFEDFKDYDYDEEEDPSEKDWEDAWQNWFPEEEYWHLLGCREDDGWLSIAIDNRLIIQVSQEEKDPYDNEKLVKVLNWLSEEVDEMKMTKWQRAPIEIDEYMK